VVEANFTNLVMVVMLVVVGCLITHLSMQRKLRQASADARQQLQQCLEVFTNTIAQLEVRVAELAGTTAALSSTVLRPPTPAVTVASEAVLTNGAASRPVSKADGEIRDGEIPAEILIVIGAAVTSFLGKKVRIRSAKMLQSPYEIVNPWAQQGRVIVQASHSLRSWGR